MPSLKIRPPGPLLDIAKQLEREGFSTWCVGGAVRDAMLGHAHLDWDLATAATPDEVRRIFGHRRTIPVGVQFGTVGVLDRNGTMHEVTTFRRDVTTDGRHATVEFGATIDEDLARRDLTINAIAYHPATGEIRDPFDGMGDIERGVVRAVGNPRERMREDRLRALRALRFAGRLGFALDPATWDAIVESAPHMGRLSAERVKQEIEKTLEQVARPSATLELWRQSGAMRVLVPSLDALPRESFAVADRLPLPRRGGKPFRKVMRLAALFGAAGSQEAAQAMTALRFSRADTGTVATVVERADALQPLIERALASGGAPSDSDVRQWIAAAGRLNVGLVMRLLAARWGARASAEGAVPTAVPTPPVIARLYRRMLRSAFADPVELADLAIDGDDLRRGGIAAGPRLGKILQALLARVIADPALNSPGTLLAIAQELDQADPGPRPGSTGRPITHEN